MKLRRAVTVVLAALALTAGAPSRVRAQTPPPPAIADHAADAQRLYGRALALYNTHHDTDALEHFRASLALLDSPNTRLFIARCLRNLGHAGEAFGEYERVVAEADALAADTARFARTRDAAAAERGALAPSVGFLAVDTAALPPAARVTLEAREIPRVALVAELPVTAGTVDVLFDAPGFRAARARVAVAAGTHVALVAPSLEREPIAPPPAPRVHAPRPRAVRLRVDTAQRDAARAAGWSGVAVGGAGWIAWGATALAANGEFDSLSPGCVAAAVQCAPPEVSAVHTGRALELAADVALGVAIAGTVAGAVGLVLGAVVPPRARRTVAWTPAGVIAVF